MTDGHIDRLTAALAGRYRIERELGQGGMATVYLAQDLRLDRPVALKVLRPNLAAVMGADRFLSEIRTTANLQHPHILPLFDSGEADGFLFYVMPYVEGESLRELFDRKEMLGVDESIRITRAVAGALQAAHDRGVIHRDIKPENILISQGEPLVADFGIAIAVDEAGGDRLTHTGLIVGTPAYMSPEQATGDKVDHRSDIYSLACVMYEALIGDVPHGGPTAHVIMARRASEPPPSARIVRDTIPEHVEEALMGALATLPADRIDRAEDFAKAISGEVRYTRPRAPVPGQRSRLGTIALVGSVAMVAIAGSYLGFGRGGPDSEVPPVTYRQVTAQPGVEDLPSITPDGEWVVYAGRGPESRDIFLQRVDGRREINLTEDSPEDDYAPSFSADGERIAFRSERDGGGLFVMDRTGEAARRINRSGFNPSWSPDGRHVVYATEHVELLPLNWDGISELWTVDMESGEELQILDGDAVQPTWSPDGEWIAFTARMTGETRMDIWVIPAGGGNPTPITEDVPADWSPAWSPDGRFIYFSSDRGGSMNMWRVAVDIAAGGPAGPPQPMTTPAAFAAHPSVSEDGQRVAFASSQMTQNVYRADFDPVSATVGEVRAITSGSRQWSSPDPSPDGSRVVFYSRDLPEGDLYVANMGGGGLRQITADSALDRMPRWSPRGDRISYFSNRSGTLQTWTISPDGSGEEMFASSAPTSWSVWSYTGDRLLLNLVFGTDSPGERVYAADDPGRGMPLLAPPDDFIPDFAGNDWSSDGRWIAGNVGVQDSGIILYDFETERFERLTEFGHWPVFLPDGRRVLFVSGGEAFYVVDRETREVREVYRESSWDVVGPPRMTRDGRALVFTRRVTEADIWLADMR